MCWRSTLPAPADALSRSAAWNSAEVDGLWSPLSSMITLSRPWSCSRRDTMSGSFRSYAITRTWAPGSAMAWSSTSRIAERASKPIQVSASSAFGLLDTKPSPSFASAGSRVATAAAPYRSTKACDDTNPRVKATFSAPG